MSKIIKSLEFNYALQDLNICSNDIKGDLDIGPLTRFIRCNTNLLHLDLSQTLNSPNQIMRIIKAVKRSVSI